MQTSIAVRDLPQTLQRALKEVGYKKADIKVETADTYSPSEAAFPFEGNYGYIVAVNLQTGATKKIEGSFGGPNPYTQKQVDVDRSKYPIPPNGAVIIGERGGRGHFAHIKVHEGSVNLAQLAAPDAGLTEQEKSALSIISSTISSYRADAFERAGLGRYSPQNPYVVSLLEKKMLKANARGALAITTQGKAYLMSRRASFRGHLRVLAG